MILAYMIYKERRIGRKEKDEIKEEDLEKNQYCDVFD
jgi:hypothetical protein